ncbi:glycosyltransferase [Roseicyclus mahoneyensis]|uniref:Glycosyltransferase involved in cell wall biosynthesis n=1 Tax=Roseicyclus mahoneyensis TaxID=164332 RepID=A0A316GKQ0_9RHOB|nr:glycosyltransferase [Roseicyclus mahoneyensis]PWK61145.1 glycosyltransferase involved in cell wall biosynthesis [Roseicyclus mahoneyensis]
MNLHRRNAIAFESTAQGFLIMAVPRSGTTLLARVMNAHPDIVCGSERFHGHTFSPESLSEIGFRTLDLERKDALASAANLREKADRPGVTFGEKFPRAYLHMRTTMPRFEEKGARLKIIVPMRNADEVAQSWYQRAVNPEDKHWPAGMYGVFPYIEQLLLMRCLADLRRPADVLLVSYEKMLARDTAPKIFDAIAEHIGVGDPSPFLAALSDNARVTQNSRDRDRSQDPTKFEAGSALVPAFTSVLGEAGTVSLADVRNALSGLMEDALANEALRRALLGALADTSDPDQISYRATIKDIYARELPSLDGDFAREAIAAMQATHQGSIAPAATLGANLVIHYDVSDVVQFLSVHGSVTGIQRVQLDAVLAAAERGTSTDQDKAVILDAQRGWISLPLKDFAQTMVSGASLEEAAKSCMEQLPRHEPACFGSRDVIVFLGATWTAPGLTTSMGDLRRSGARIVTYIHDVLPLEMPENFPKGHAKAFEQWLKTILTNSAAILCNSEETKAALLAHARVRLPVGVVNLDIMPTFVKEHLARPEHERRAPLDALELASVDYVLAVGTLEPRKNHLTLINAWTALQRKLGTSCPKLVLVGKDGWKTAGIHEALESSSDHCDILLLQHTDNETLAALYENALMTVSISRGEGWNLPVTESLASGVPVFAGRASAAKAALQGLAFETDALSERNVRSRLQEVLSDREGLARKRALVRQKARFKEWGDLIMETRRFIDKMLPAGPVSYGVQTRHPYRYGRDQESDLKSNRITGLQMRTGLGWNAPDSWGCWSSASIAEIDLFDLPVGSYTAYAVLTTTDKLTSLPLKVRGPDGPTWQGTLHAGQRSLVAVDFDLPPSVQGKGTLTFTSGEPYDFANDDSFAEMRTLGFALIELVLLARADMAGRVETMEVMLSTYMAH